MEYQYNQISCYYSKGEKLFLIPKGELLPFGGGIDIEPAFELQIPLSKTELEDNINKVFSLCWTVVVNGIPKGPSVIEKYSKTRGYKKIVQKFDFFTLTYDKNEKKYNLMKSFKDTDNKCYSGMETIEMGDKIDFDYIMSLISTTN